MPVWLTLRLHRLRNFADGHILVHATRLRRNRMFVAPQRTDITLLRRSKTRTAKKNPDSAAVQAVARPDQPGRTGAVQTFLITIGVFNHQPGHDSPAKNTFLSVRVEQGNV